MNGLILLLCLSSIPDRPYDGQIPPVGRWQLPSKVQYGKFVNRPYVGMFVTIGETQFVWCSEYRRRGERIDSLCIWFDSSREDGWGINLTNRTIWRHCGGEVYEFRRATP